MGDDAKPPPAKRQRMATAVSQVSLRWGPDVVVRLLDEDAGNLGLSDPVVMKFLNLEHLTFNSSTVSYLYTICAAIFDIGYDKLTLTHTPTVKFLDKDDDDDDTRMAWPLSEDADQISKGTYCIMFDTDAGTKFNVILGLIVLEPNLDLCQVQRRKAKSSAEEMSTTPVTPSSTMPPPRKTPAKRTPVQPPSSPAIPQSPGQSSDSIRQLVTDRDRGCIITNSSPSMCLMSHIIPRHILEVCFTPS